MKKTKRVFIATEGSHDDYHVIGVFNSVRQAQAALDKLGPPNDDTIIEAPIGETLEERQTFCDSKERMELWREYKKGKPKFSLKTWEAYYEAHKQPDSGLIKPYGIKKSISTMALTNADIEKIGHRRLNEYGFERAEFDLHKIIENKFPVKNKPLFHSHKKSKGGCSLTRAEYAFVTPEILARFNESPPASLKA